MKKALIAILFVISLTTFAQEKKQLRREREKMTSEQKVDKQVKKLTADLALNEKQVKQVRLLMEKEVQKHKEKRVEMTALREKKMAARKAIIEEKKAQMQEERAKVSDEMKNILSADQFAKWAKIKEERHSEMQEKMTQRKGKKQNKN
jgi:hypothetical protein